MRPFLIYLPFNRSQDRGEPGLAFGQQLAHVFPVLDGSAVPGPLRPSLNVSAHKTSPGVDDTILPLTPPSAAPAPGQASRPGGPARRGPARGRPALRRPAPGPRHRRRARRRCRAGSSLARGGRPARAQPPGPAPRRPGTGADDGNHIRVASIDDRTRPRFPSSRQTPGFGYRLAGMPGVGSSALHRAAGRPRGRPAARERGPGARSGDQAAVHGPARDGADSRFTVDTTK